MGTPGATIDGTTLATLETPAAVASVGAMSVIQSARTLKSPAACDSGATIRKRSLSAEHMAIFYRILDQAALLVRERLSCCGDRECGWFDPQSLRSEDIGFANADL